MCVSFNRYATEGRLGSVAVKADAEGRLGSVAVKADAEGRLGSVAVKADAHCSARRRRRILEGSNPACDYKNILIHSYAQHTQNINIMKIYKHEFKRRELVRLKIAQKRDTFVHDNSAVRRALFLFRITQKMYQTLGQFPDSSWQN